MWLLQQTATSLVSFVLVDQLRLLLFRHLRLLSAFSSAKFLGVSGAAR